MVLIFKIRYNITPLQNVILPTPSSKVMKYLIQSGKILPSLKDLILSRDKYKPIFISHLGLNQRRIFQTNGNVKTISKGMRLSSTIAFSTQANVVQEIVDEGVFETAYGKFHLMIEDVEIVEVEKFKEEIERHMKDNIRIRFISPAILSSKVLLPPSLSERYKKVDAGYSTLPSVGLIMAYAYDVYSNLIGKKEIEVRAFKLGVLSNALSRIMGYDLHPVTVAIGEDKKGNLRKARGVMGWIEFDIPDEKLKRRALRYLLPSSYLGIGRSRGIGFGEIRLEFRKVEKEKKE
ncbi:CRISPR-associated endoribonuclease Cas6 [Acidianus sulfidivorans JP7]|uniref:CRISPR-associated endoribonuclease Cas6 n=1 Tax=Acidianus sulfidivorans JP7 TaxID=619593 RepID=A0A2U9IQ17_9CREN|nr:CRISPR-associated endoribonuclease Cas6 [Acidianus sulfidivorans]AWR98111.1 CRISPR-associated endoribonuclease Cas6 [Acidianus sulfidivorans JP7]